ncbi:MAG: hypothetical protein LKI24_04430 [Acidipropionibacterium sp.]|nr:hypothetical protein [Acidipropionibacterium sp.]
MPQHRGLAQVGQRHRCVADLDGVTALQAPARRHRQQLGAQADPQRGGSGGDPVPQQLPLVGQPGVGLVVQGADRGSQHDEQVGVQIGDSLGLVGDVQVLDAVAGVAQHRFDDAEILEVHVAQRHCAGHLSDPVPWAAPL